MKIEARNASFYTHERMLAAYGIPSRAGKRRTRSPYERLRNRIYREFPRKKLIGDIFISDEEFDLLIKYLRIFYRELQREEWEICADIMVSVAMVQIGIRYYDGSYWPHFAKLLDNATWHQGRQSVISKIFFRTLRVAGKAVLDEGDWMATILMHGFVANGYASNMLDFLFAYYRIDLERDLSRNTTEMMRELVKSIQDKDNSNRTYKLVQQTSDAFTVNPRGGNVRLRWLLRMMDASFWGEDVRINPENRLACAFREWSEKSESFVQTKLDPKSKVKVHSTPHLFLNTAKQNFEVRLPAQLVRVTENIFWKCSIGTRTLIIPVEAYESVLAYKTEQVTLQVTKDEIFEKMSFVLIYGDYEKPFTLPAESARFFSSDGYSLNPTTLKKGTYYVFAEKNSVIESTALIEHHSWGNTNFCFLDVEDGDIVKLPNGHYVCVGKHIEEGLLLHGIVKDTFSTEDRLPVYSSIPSILVKMKESSMPGTAISVNGVKYRLGASNVTEISLEDGSGEKGYWFSLSDIVPEKNGLYDVDVDVPNDKTNRHWRFALVHGLDYHFDENAPYIFQEKGTIFVKAKGMTVIPQSEIIEKDRDEGFYNFIIRPEVQFLAFTIDNIDISFDLPHLEYSFDSLSWYTQRYTAIWHAEFPAKIWIRFPSSTVEFEMDNGEVYEEEQCETFNKRHEDNLFECDMTRFRSWFNHEHVKNTLLLNVQGQSISFLDVIARSFVTRCMVGIDPESGCLKVSCDIIGKGMYYLDLSYKDKHVVEKTPIIDGSSVINIQARSGSYCVDVFEGEDNSDFDFDDVGYIHIFSTHTQIVNPNDLIGKTLKLTAVVKDPHDVFKKPLQNGVAVYITNQRDDLRYEGSLKNPSTGTTVKVVLDIYDVRNLRFARMSWIDIDYDEEDFLLYDSYRRTVVREENRQLPSAQRYRRYDCLFTDEYLFEFVI